MLLAMNWRKEIKERVKQIDAIKENYKDAKAELEEVRLRDPLTRTKAKAESNGGNAGKSNEHICMVLSNKERQLRKQMIEYKTIMNDHRKGWRTLDKDQKQVLELRFKHGQTQEQTGKTMGYDIRTVRRIEDAALDKMEKHMTKY